MIRYDLVDGLLPFVGTVIVNFCGKVSGFVFVIVNGDMQDDRSVFTLVLISNCCVRDVIKSCGLNFHSLCALIS